jgi:hypothetical protein
MIEALNSTQFLQEPHGATSQRIAFFRVRTVKTKNRTRCNHFLICGSDALLKMDKMKKMGEKTDCICILRLQKKGNSQSIHLLLVSHVCMFLSPS